MVFEVLQTGVMRPRERSLRWMLLWSGVCAAIGLMSLMVSDTRPGQVIIWMSNPVGAVALLRLQRSQWPAMLAALSVAVWAVHLVYAGGAGAEYQAWISPMTMVWRAGVDVPVHLLEMMLSAFMLDRIRALEHAGDRATVQGVVLLRAAFLPAAALAPLGGLAWLGVAGGDWPEMALNWFVGHTIGTVAALPLALSVATKHPRVALAQVTEPLAMAMLLGSMAVTLWAGTSLPKPFVVMVAPVMWMAVRTNLVTTFAANLLIAVSMAALIRHGVLLPPPTSSWWGDGLFYLSVLATLLPGLFLAVMSEGQRRALQVLADSEARARALYFKTPAMMHSMDAQGRIVQVSKLWLDTLGYAETEVLGRQLADFMVPASARKAREVQIPAATGDGHCDNMEYQLCRRDGTLCDVILSAIWEYDEDQQPVRSLAVLQDVTEKKRLEVRSHFAEHDALTGLPNRVLLQDRLKMLCAHYGRHKGVFAIGFLDLDHFKEVNDNYGHELGDVLLKEVARRLQGTLRATDTVCRLGGDEFVMIFSAVEGRTELQALAAKLMVAIAGPCMLGEGPDAPVVQVSGSLGLALFPEHGTEPQVLLTHADQAMYAAKRSGRNRCEFYRGRA